MTKSPIKRVSQKDYVHSAVRFPPALRDEIRDAAERNGRSFNAEVLARLQDRPSDAVMAELREMKQMLRLLLNKN